MTSTILNCSTGVLNQLAPDPPGLAASLATFTAAQQARDAQRLADLNSVLADATINPALIRVLGIQAPAAITPGQ